MKAALILVCSAAIALLAQVAAGAQVPPIARGASEVPLESGGLTRTVQVFRPSDADRQTALPLVIMLHGLHTNGDDGEYFYHWDALARIEHFVVAYPSGIDRSWNAGTCCRPASTSGIDDVAFITDLARRMSVEPATTPGGLVDPKRIYVAGFSNGGMMAYRLACQSSFHFAAIGSAEGALVTTCDAPAPVSFLELHGLADTGIPFEGGPSANDPHSRPFLSSVRSVEPFVNADRCGGSTTTTGPLMATRTWSCPDGRSVDVISVPGMPHLWPTEPHQAIDAPQLMWKFFSEHTA